MPKTPKTSSSDIDNKPYIKPEPISPTPTSTTPGPKKTKSKGAAWTAAERLAIFDVAMTKGASAKNFEEVVEGRSGKACYDTWINTLKPMLRKILIST